MAAPTLFHDPTSEPSRAVHWFAAEAGIALDLEPIWLTRGDHRSPAFLAINPGHQVPALKHGDLCLTEAAAIMIYLAEIGGRHADWVGRSPAERAQTHRFLSWHHTNTRLRITLDYVLPALLMPAYTGIAPPPADEVRRRRDRGRESVALLEVMLADRGPFLGGDRPTVADPFIAADLFALDIDADRNDWFRPCPSLRGWLDRLRDREGYRLSHAPWNAVVPRVKELLSEPVSMPRDPAWVADVCLEHMP